MSAVRLIASRTLTARKPHRCRCCMAVAVQPGELYDRDTFAFDGRVYDWITCKGCAAITQLVYSYALDSYEGITEDDYSQWAADFASDPLRGEEARAYIARRANA